VFQRTQGFPLGQRATYSTFPTDHRFWDTKNATVQWVNPGMMLLLLMMIMMVMVIYKLRS
jgi:hypothetical protein